MNKGENKMDYETIINNINSGVYDNEMKYPMDAFLSENYIFDENLSVKENRRMVEEHNQKIKEEKQSYRNENLRLKKLFERNIISYLTSSFNINVAQAELFFINAYDDSHSSGYHEVLNTVNEMVGRYLEISSLE